VRQEQTDLAAVVGVVHRIHIVTTAHNGFQFWCLCAEIHAMSPLAQFLPSRMLRKLTPRHSAPPSSLMGRTQVCPPELWPSSLTLWGRAQRWLMKDHPWTPQSARPPNRLAMVKSEFNDSLHGLTGLEADRLADQIDRARSLRELWHLRSALYGQLAVTYSQSEAERRMTTLNRHFPTRAPRSGTLPADA
jgi:hypothetical protein